MPIMLRSSNCVLAGKSEAELAKLQVPVVFKPLLMLHGLTHL
jgi:hypothetical protein